MTRDIPIIFSTAMVQALLDGRKTQTRRLASSPLAKAKPGDRLWVREAFMLVGSGDPGVPIRRAGWRDDAKAQGLDNIPAAEPHGWSPSIHMPRWASRLTLAVTSVRFQPLQGITEEDAQAEGSEQIGSYRDGYANLWRTLHTKSGQRWGDNPDIVALTFAVHRCNIDALPDSPRAGGGA